MSTCAEAVCRTCHDTGTVCEEHPDRPWQGLDVCAPACCGGAGMPCPACCDPIPMDGTRQIIEAFTPRHLTKPRGY